MQSGAARIRGRLTIYLMICRCRQPQRCELRVSATVSKFVGFASLSVSPWRGRLRRWADRPDSGAFGQESRMAITLLFPR
jgi:hypothetical protein